MDFLVVVFAQLLFLLNSPRPQWLLDVMVGIFAAHHEANLAAGVCRNRRIGVFGDGEDLSTGLLEVDDKLPVKPLVLSCGAKID